MVICYLGIGANLGDRNRNIKEAIKKINLLKDTKVIKISKIIETKPVGGPPAQGNFLNAALKIQTRISPLKLLKDLKKIEKGLGRTKSVKYGPRAIDLDILFYGDRIINTEELTIPHPRLFARDFVLKPLSEVI
jgi:2-amino-4-hydroxy-6-hydroxymethyldihydropteridine diphosphokinase